MGQSVSAAASDKHKPLYAQRVFEPTIHRRFIKDRVVSIELEDNFWTKPRADVLELKDDRSGQVLFKLPAQDGNPETKSQRKVLLDAFGVPVVGLEWTNEKPTNAQYVITPGGSNTAGEQLYRFETGFNPYFYPLKLVVNEESDKDCTILYVIGSWLARRAVVGIRRGIEGDVFKIAEFNAVESVDSGKYRLEVAPGVDIAMMLMFAAAMDEQARLHFGRSDLSALKYERKRERLRKEKIPAMEAAAFPQAMAQQRLAPVAVAPPKEATKPISAA